MSDESLQVVDDVSDASAPVADVKDQTEQTDNTEPNAEAVEVEDNTDEQKPSEDDASEAEQNEGDKKPEISDADKVRHAMQKRIDRLIAEKAADAERRAQEQKQQPEQQIVDKGRPKAPDVLDYGSDSEYQEAVKVYEAELETYIKEKSLRDAQIEAKQREQMELKETLKAQFDEREHKYRLENPDYDLKSEIFKSIVDDYKHKYRGENPGLNAVSQVIIESDVAPNLISFIADNPQYTEQFEAMTPVQAARAMFKLEMQLSETPKAEAQTKPKPISPLKGTGKSAPDPKNMSTDEYMKWRSARKS